MEKTVIYLDVLLILNLFVNFLLLLSTKRLLQQEAKPLRIFLSALLGSVYSLVILLPDFSLFSLFLQKIFLSFLMTMIAFGKKSAGKFLFQWLLFLGISFLYGGFLYAIWFFITPNGMIYQNGIVYLPISIITLAITTILIYLLLWLFGLFFHRNIPSVQKVKIKIYLEELSVTLNALVDTGHRAVDVMTGLSVVLCEYTALLPILPKEMIPFLEELDTTSIGKWEKKVRIIPLQTVIGKNVIPAFRPDHFYLLDNSGQKIEKSVLIGVVKEKICDGEVKALIPDTLL